MIEFMDNMGRMSPPFIWPALDDLQTTEEDAQKCIVYCLKGLHSARLVHHCLSCIVKHDLFLTNMPERIHEKFTTSTVTVACLKFIFRQCFKSIIAFRCANGVSLSVTDSFLCGTVPQVELRGFFELVKIPEVLAKSQAEVWLGDMEIPKGAWESFCEGMIQWGGLSVIDHYKAHVPVPKDQPLKKLCDTIFLLLQASKKTYTGTIDLLPVALVYEDDLKVCLCDIYKIK